MNPGTDPSPAVRNPHAGDDDLPVLTRVLRPGRVAMPAPMPAATLAATTPAPATSFAGLQASMLAAQAAQAMSAAAPAAASDAARAVMSAAVVQPAPAAAASLSAASATLAPADRAALEERIRQTVIDDLQIRLPEVIRECLDRNLEPLLAQAASSLQVEIRDSLHGMVADSIERILQEPPRDPDEPLRH